MQRNRSTALPALSVGILAAVLVTGNAWGGGQGASVCGDGICETEEGEDACGCPEDCGKPGDFDCVGELVNVALGRPTAQGSQLGGFGPGLAVDGNLGNFTHTAAGQDSWWRVDLGAELPISGIVLYNRTSCCASRLRDIIIQILDANEEIVDEIGPLNEGNEGFACPSNEGPMTLDWELLDAPVAGRYVRVERIHDTGDLCAGGNADENSVLSLGEVEVFVDAADIPMLISQQPQGARVYTGSSVDLTIGVEGGGQVTYQWRKDGEDITDATAPTLSLVDVTPEDAGDYDCVITSEDGSESIVSDVARVEVPGNNIAVCPSAFASQSTTGFGGDANRARDGNTNGVYPAGSTTHTNSGDPNPFWELVLPTASTVDTVVVWNRTDCCSDRLTNFRVEVLDGELDVLHSSDHFTDGGNPDPNEEIAVGVDGARVVRVSRLGLDNDPGQLFLSLAEVEVFGQGDCPAPPPNPNVATRGTVSQSSTLGGYNAGLAIDGNTGNFTHTQANADLGEDQMGVSWWEADFGAEYEVASIEAFNRGGGCCQSRFRDITFVLYVVDGEERVEVYRSELLNAENVLGEGGTAGPASLLADLVEELGEPVVGRILRIERTPDLDNSGTGGVGNADESTVLSLGEVVVLEPTEPCPEGGPAATLCEGLEVTGPDVGGAGIYRGSLVAAADGEGDEVPVVTFELLSGDVVLGSTTQRSKIAPAVLLPAGDYTLRATVDQDPNCPDESTCSVDFTVTECPLVGDTHCRGLEIVGPDGGGEGSYRVAADAEDDSGDGVFYTFTASAEGVEDQVVGPQVFNSTSFDLTAGEWTISVSIDDDLECDDVTDDAICSQTVSITPPGGLQLPGDANQDGRLDISDASSLLGFLFLGSPTSLPCGDGTNVHPANIALLSSNGDPNVDLSDAVGVLNFLFLGGPPPALGVDCVRIPDCLEEVCAAD